MARKFATLKAVHRTTTDTPTNGSCFVRLLRRARPRTHPSGKLRCPVLQSVIARRAGLTANTGFATRSGVLAYFAPVDWEFLNPSDAGEPPADAPVRAAIDAVLAFPAATETTYDLPGHEPKETTSSRGRPS